MTRIPLIAAALAALAVAGCGSSSSSSSSTAPATSAPAPAPATPAAPSTPTGASTITQSADPSGALKFTKSSLSAKAGKVTINFTNSSPVGHNLTVASAGGTVVGATPTFSGGSKTVSLNLKPGTYTFYCSVPGHRMAGMQGTLVVK